VAEALRVSPTLPGAGPAETAIEPLETSVTAFIGRTLRGPLSAPTTIDSFKAYERQFGGLWQPSTLSYAVEQYFEQGGRAAIIVRVASGARAPSLQLPTADGMLRLRGVALNDYDIIGNAEAGSGLFALSQAREHFSMLCVPPLDREHDIGYSTLVVAGRICRQRHSLLIVDPPSSWNSVDAAIAGLRDWPFQNADACMYFPRVTTLDRLRGQLAEFAGCGAVAGLIAHADARCPVWGAAAGEESLLRSPLRPAVNVGDRERERLLHYGVNTLRTARAAAQSTHWPTTLVPELNARPEKRILAVRRLGHYVVSSVVRGTRWTLLEATDPKIWLRLRVQVEAFLESVAVQGALVGDRPEDGYFVICDERLNRAVGQHPRELNLLFGIAALRPREFQAWLVTHRAAGSTVRAVSVNRRFTEAVQAQDEIETAILRGVLRENVLREGVTA
jgi:phage tail sheath protein FI